jgi:RTA1 like protein
MANAPSSLYPFHPSTAAAILFTVLYFLLAAHHTYIQAIYPRLRLRRHNHASNNPCRGGRHNYTIPTALAAGLSTSGYALRIASIKMDSEIGIYASSSSLIVISPIFVCATLYLLIARLIRRSLPPTSSNTRNSKDGLQHPQRFFKVPPLWIGRLFITSDVLSFLTQGGGTSIAAGGNWEGDSAKIGTNILLLGLSLQLATFTAFIVLLWRFVCRVRIVEGASEPNIKKLLVGVVVASACIEVRSVYRVVEFALGVEGYPFQHEWPLYVLEAVPMWGAIAAMGWWHPVRLVPEGMVVKEEKGVAAGHGDVELERGIEGR